MRRATAGAALALLVVLLAGCGGTTRVHERTVVVPPNQAGEVPPTSPRPSGGVRIAVVTHGQASSPFWAIVRNGVEAAARQMDVVVQYRAPDVYSLARMEALIDQAVASHPDGLVVSIPERGLAPAIRRAVKAGIPVVSINSGSDIYRRLGVLAHIGQPEERAGFEAGRRLAAAGVHRALCVNQQIGNAGLDARCRGLARAMRGAGGGCASARGRRPEHGDPAPDRRRRAQGRHRRRPGAELDQRDRGGQGRAPASGRSDAVKVATFDLGPDVLRAVRAHQLLFAVDQQAYLQGYLPIVLLTERARYGLFPAQGDVLPTGPNFVTARDAGKAIELSKRSIR